MQKSVWGPVTWRLLHMMVLKANDNLTPTQIIELKNIILRILTNLPCPYCTSHAMAHITSSNYKSIQNVADLRVFMFQFHNKVNQRLNKNLITYEQHTDIYCKLQLVPVINDFIINYQSKNSGVTMMLYNFHRKQMVLDVIKYFKANTNVFNLNSN
jgi:hypothetical protein